MLFDAEDAKTKVKPFLLVSDDYINPSLDEIRLDYNYRLIDEYEKTENSMAVNAARETTLVKTVMVVPS